MTDYTYTEKPKTVKAVKWDGNLETLPAIADLTKEVNTGYYPGGEWESLVLSQGCMGVKLVITSEATDYHVPEGCYVVVDEGKLSVLPKQEFESKYQKEEQIWGDSILSHEKGVSGEGAKKSMEDILDKIRKEAAKATPGEPFYWPRNPHRQDGPYNPYPGGPVGPTIMY